MSSHIDCVVLILQSIAANNCRFLVPESRSRFRSETILNSLLKNQCILLGSENLIIQNKRTYSKKNLNNQYVKKKNHHTTHNVEY